MGEIGENILRYQQVMGGAVVVHAHKALILKRNQELEDVLPGEWEFPEGKKKMGETLAKAVIRECKEETGLDVEVIQFVDYFEFGTASHEVVRDFTQINFLCRIVGEAAITLSPSHEAFAWVEEADIDRYVLNDQRRRTLKKAFALAAGLEKRVKTEVKK
jgi:8-oxo-dGTP diphosphatase